MLKAGDMTDLRFYARMYRKSKSFYSKLFWLNYIVEITTKKEG